jgi:hypothetical protein
MSNPSLINKVTRSFDENHNSELRVILMVIAEVSFELIKNICKDNEHNKVPST